MDIEAIFHNISLIIAPVVMISACTLLMNGLLARYEAISMRMRMMNHERIDILQALAHNMVATSMIDFRVQRAQEIVVQLPHILQRHTMIHNAAFNVSLSILIFIASMLIIALSALTSSNLIAMIAFFTFLLGTCVLLLAVLSTIRELAHSQREVAYEVQHVLALGDDDKKE